MSTIRRLAAILAADVAGYSRLMGIDEVGTLEALKAHRREVVDPTIAANRGRIVKTTGDGLLVEFASAVDAVTCAMSIQEQMVARGGDIRFRIGINIGDIISDGDDIFGDGVNVAVRVENECTPGGVCLSDDAHRQVRSKTTFVFEDLGEKSLKNIDRPVRLFASRVGLSVPSPLVGEGQGGGSRGHVSTSRQTPTSGPNLSAQGEGELPLPDKPSIAVLPFQNMSGDPEQEYFADGMVEEIITALSRFKWLFVIARNSSFTYKGKAVDIKDVGRQLGVRYVLEGSVRKASGKVRITGQLIDALTGVHIWADRFERDLTDVFALQDDVTVAVVSAVQPKLLQTEIALASRRRPENLTAYDYYLRAVPQLSLNDREGLAEALKLSRRALELDPRYGLVAALAGHCHMRNVLAGYATDPQFERKEAVRLSRLALSLDDSDPEILARAATIAAFMIGESETEMVDRAVALNPNSLTAWSCRGQVYRIAGLMEEAVRSFEHAMRVIPVDPLLQHAFVGLGYALIELGRFDEAVATAKKAQRQNPHYSPAYRNLASALAHLGRDAEAREAVEHLLKVDPGFTISAWTARGGQPNAKLMIEGLRKAGLPE